jgi:hypothetical protein
MCSSRQGVTYVLAQRHASLAETAAPGRRSAAPLHMVWSGGSKPPNAGRSTSIECRTIRHTRSRYCASASCSYAQKIAFLHYNRAYSNLIPSDHPVLHCGAPRHAGGRGRPLCLPRDGMRTRCCASLLENSVFSEREETGSHGSYN